MHGVILVKKFFEKICLENIKVFFELLLLLGLNFFEKIIFEKVLEFFLGFFRRFLDKWIVYVDGVIPV